MEHHPRAPRHPPRPTPVLRAGAPARAMEGRVHRRRAAGGVRRPALLHEPAQSGGAEHRRVPPEHPAGRGTGRSSSTRTYVLLIEGISRSCSHELVRHRAGWGYSQLSQRYVDESHAAFVMPPAIQGDPALEAAWTGQVEAAQAAYVEAVERLMERYGWVDDRVHRRKMAREAARSVLPNATEVKIVASANVRAWRTMLELRLGEGAELEIRRMAVACLRRAAAGSPGALRRLRDLFRGRRQRGRASRVPQGVGRRRAEGKGEGSSRGVHRSTTRAAWHLRRSTFPVSQKLLCVRNLFLTLVSSTYPTRPGSSLADGLFCRGCLWQFGSDSPSISSPRRRLTQPGRTPTSPSSSDEPPHVGRCATICRSPISTPSGTSPPPSTPSRPRSPPSARSTASRPTRASPLASRCSGPTSCSTSPRASTARTARATSRRSASSSACPTTPRTRSPWASRSHKGGPRRS